jgi:hypothetical protein
MLTGPALWIAGALALLAWIGAALLERRRADSPRRRALRLLLLAGACATLFLLAAQPLRWRRVAPGEAVLLTPGATARDLAAASAAGLPAWAVPAAAGESAPPAGAVVLADAASLARLHPEVSRLRLAGYGLAPWELAELPLPVAAGAPPASPFGIARIAWPRRVTLGESVEVAGVAVGVPTAGARVRLAGAAIGTVAAPLAAGSAPFRLRVEPRGPGHHLLELRLEAPSRSPVVEQLDVEVVAEKPPAVLWLEAAPTAEGREMKRWLAAAGGAFAWRAQVSRGIARDEVAGTAALPRGPLSAALLAPFDLVVVESRALENLGAAERTALAAAVREGGAGVLLRAAGATAPALFGVTFASRPLPGGGELAARLDWGESASAPLPLPARELVPDGTRVTLVADRAGRTLAAWRPLGRGAAGVSLVDDTWRWVLAGRPDDHHHYWRDVIAALARRAPPQQRWEVAPGPLLVGLPVTLTLSGATALPPAATVRAPNGELVTIPLRQDADEPSRWSTILWPREPGWHTLGEGAAATRAWIAPADRWTAWRLAARQEATAARVAAPPTVRQSAEVVRRRAPVPRWPLFLVLLATLATLWADEQFGARPSREAG